MLNQPRVPPIHSSLSLSLFLIFPLFFPLCERSLRPFYFLPRTAAFELLPLPLPPRILIPFLRTSTRSKITPLVAVTNYNAGKKYYFYRGKRPTFSGIPITDHRYYCISFGIWAWRALPLAIFPSSNGNGNPKDRRANIPYY